MRMATGDLKPDLTMTLSASDPVDATAATGIRILGRRDDTLIIDRTPDQIAVVGDTSVLTMLWQDGDTDSIGRIQFEAELTWPGNKVQTFRASGGVDIYRDFDQLGLVIPPLPDVSEIAADEFVNTVLNLHAKSWTTITDAIDDAVAALVGAAPTTLDTLNELAVALGNDPNLATTLTNLIGLKASTASLNAAVQTALDQRLLLAARNPDLIIAGAITRDGNGAATSAPVTWPGGTPGTYTADTVSTVFPGAVDAYHITYGSPVTRTYTQPALTRDGGTGAVTNLPAIVVT